MNMLSDLALDDYEKATEWCRHLGKILTNGFPGWEFTVKAEDTKITIGTKHKDWDSWTDEFQWSWIIGFEDWFCKSACREKMVEILHQISNEMAERLNGHTDIAPEFSMNLEALGKMFHEDLSRQVGQEIAREVDQAMIETLFGTDGNTMWHGRKS